VRDVGAAKTGCRAGGHRQCSHAGSAHYGDVEKWVRKVIDSCETYQQTFTARILVQNFEKQMRRNKVDSDFIWSVRSSLDTTLSYKRDELLKKQLES
jgi:hypothetical protein